MFVAAGSEREQHIAVSGRVQRGHGDWFGELRNRPQVYQQTRSVWCAAREVEVSETVSFSADGCAYALKKSHKPVAGSADE